MNIEFIEDKLENIKDEKQSLIIELIVNAVRDYPLFDLDDTDNFFEEVKRKLGEKYITKVNLKKYLDSNLDCFDTINIWINSSLESLLQAFILMEKSNISFEEIIDQINNIY